VWYYGFFLPPLHKRFKYAVNFFFPSLGGIAASILPSFLRSGPDKAASDLPPLFWPRERIRFFPGDKEGNPRRQRSFFSFFPSRPGEITFSFMGDEDSDGRLLFEEEWRSTPFERVLKGTRPPSTPDGKSASVPLKKGRG